MKKVLVVAVCLSLVFATSAFAGGSYGDKRGGWGQGKKSYGAAGMVLMHADELGISKEQQEAMKEKKYALKKEMVSKKAEIELVGIDLARELSKDQVDLTAVNALVDRKYQLKAEKKKEMLKAYADIKNSLTEEQKEKLKALCQEGKCGGFKKTGMPGVHNMDRKK